MCFSLTKNLNLENIKSLKQVEFMIGLKNYIKPLTNIV